MKTKLLLLLLFLPLSAFALPDVIIASLAYKDGVFTSTVKNIGTTAVPPGTVIGVRYSVDGLSKTWGSTPSGLVPGVSVTIGTNGGAYVIPPGNHIVQAWVDDVNRFVESNETNNLFSITVAVAPPKDAVQGFAASAGVTGGAGGQSIVVTNCNGDASAGSLKAAIAVKAARIITFKPGMVCVINWLGPNVVYVDTGNMTLDGAGAKITIAGMSLSVHTVNSRPVTNVIIRHLTFANNFSDRNAISVDYGSSGVWIDHNTFYNNSVGNTGQGVSINHQGTTYDGLAPKGITISWNYFKVPNKKAILVQSNNDLISTPMRVSIHHNRVEHIDARMPRMHGKDIVVHAWNNYLYDWKEYAMASSNSANLLAENNYFENTQPVFKQAIVAAYGVPSAGYWKSDSVGAMGNFLGGNPTPTIETLGVFPRWLITYTVALEPADTALKARIIAGAGNAN